MRRHPKDRLYVRCQSGVCTGLAVHTFCGSKPEASLKKKQEVIPVAEVSTVLTHWWFQGKILSAFHMPFHIVACDVKGF